MINIGRQCSIPRVEDKVSLGSVTIIYALLQYPFPFICPSRHPPHACPLPPPQTFLRVRLRPQPHPCIHPTPPPPASLKRPCPPVTTTNLVTANPYSSPYPGIGPELDEYLCTASTYFPPEDVCLYLLKTIHPCCIPERELLPRPIHPLP